MIAIKSNKMQVMLCETQYKIKSRPLQMKASPDGFALIQIWIVLDNMKTMPAKSVYYNITRLHK